MAESAHEKNGCSKLKAGRFGFWVQSVEKRLCLLPASKKIFEFLLIQNPRSFGYTPALGSALRGSFSMDETSRLINPTSSTMRP